jgi:hypothetical protein
MTFLWMRHRIGKSPILDRTPKPKKLISRQARLVRLSAALFGGNGEVDHESQVVG